jgi:acetyl esterase/lipase
MLRTSESYGTEQDADPARHQVDIYRPAQGRDHPVLLFAHGGVWQMGSKDEYRHIGEAFARRGIVTAVANYRLTPAVRHPSHVQDLARVVAWLMSRVEQYGGRRDRVFLSGHSAGGHLVSLLLFDRRYLQAEGIDSEALAGILPLSGVFDLTQPIDDTPEGGFGRYIYPPFSNDPAALRAASPVAHLRPTGVPIYVVLAGDDYRNMRNQSIAFVGALLAKNISVTFETVAGRGHFELVQRIGTPGDPTTGVIASFVQAPRR